MVKKYTTTSCKITCIQNEEISRKNFGFDSRDVTRVVKGEKQRRSCTKKEKKTHRSTTINQIKI